MLKLSVKERIEAEAERIIAQEDIISYEAAAELAGIVGRLLDNYSQNNN